MRWRSSRVDSYAGGERVSRDTDSAQSSKSFGSLADGLSEDRAGLIVRGGTIVLESEMLRADVVIEGGRVEALTAPDHWLRHEAEVLDATGCLVLPGAVDVHTHVGLSFGEFTTRDDFAAATRAASLGGTTTILEFAIPNEGETPMEAIERRMISAAEVCYVDYGFHACVARSADQTSLQDIERAADIGVTSVKVFTAYRGIVMLELGDVQAVMQAAARSGSTVMVHAETESLVERAIEDLGAADSLHPRNLPRARPPEVELDAARSVLGLAATADCTVYLVHVTLPEVADEIARARGNGIAAFGESCPHYLLLDDSCYETNDPHLFVCSPPIRPAGTAQELWSRLGQLTGVHSDHCCFDSSQKVQYGHDLRLIPPGLPGIQTRLPVMLSEALKGRMALTELVRLCASEPARLFGIAGKGSLLPGYDADVVVVRPDATTKVREGLDMDTDYCPFDGRLLQGRIDIVISKGSVLVADGKWAEAQPNGAFLKRARRPRRTR